MRITTRRAVKHFGSNAAIAQKLGITRGAVRQWRKYIPKKYVDVVSIAISKPIIIPADLECGIRCPDCDSYNTSVLDSRPSPNRQQRRRRKCEDCGKRNTTYEVLKTDLDLIETARTALINLKALAELTI